MLTLFLKGLITGFAIAAPVGPIGILCIQRSLQNGFKVGLMTGMGAALADGTYGLIAGFGLTVISTMLVTHQFWIRIIGGLFLLYLGIKIVLTPPREKPVAGKADKSPWHACATTYLLTLMNPMTILSFVAIFAGLGLGSIHPDYMHAILLVIGITLGSSIWWLFLSGGVALVLHHRITSNTMRAINVLSGMIMLAFGAFALKGLVLTSHSTFQAPQFSNLGSFHHEISTKIPLAQRFFDQGLVLFYGFEWGESIRSFQEATHLDPHCGMCYWGLALALGNKINAPMTGHEYSDAQSAIQKAMELKEYETPVEQDYIKALSLRFQHAPKISNKAGAFSCHLASGKHDESTAKELKTYSDAMKIIVEKYPNDMDAKALYAYSLFNRISWNFWDAHGTINPLTPSIIQTLKALLAKDPFNIAGNHYYIHVIEQSPQPEYALENADRLKTLVPGSEHLIHMPAHIYFLTGRYHEGTESNLKAIEAFKQYNNACYAQGFKPEANYLYFHNYDFLRTTASMEGRKKLALSSAKKIVDSPFPTWLAKEPTLQWFIPIPYFVEARFGLWDVLLNEPMPKSDYQYAEGMWHYARGMAFAHTDHLKEANNELSNLRKIVAKGEAQNNLGKSGHNLLKIANEILSATITNFQGDEKSTFTHLKLADKIQYDMGYHEPPDWYFPVKEILGDAYLKWNHPAEAAVIYQQDLKQYPENGWALYGLSLALRQQHKNDEAEQVEKQFKKAWQYADIPIPVGFF